MLPLVLALTLGAGVYLFYDGVTRPRVPKAQGGRVRLNRVRALLVAAGLHELSPAAFVLFSVAAGLIAGVAAQVILGWGLVSLLAAALGLVIPGIYVSQRAERRRAAVQGGLVDAIGHLRDGIRTGLSVQEALVGVARSGPEALRGEFTALVREWEQAGENHPSRHTLRRVFGSWNAAIAEAGFTPRPRGRPRREALVEQ